MSTTTTETAYAEIYSPLKVLQHSAGQNCHIAAFYNPAHEIHLVEKPRPTPGPGQVLLHVRATGICGSDVHFWKHGRIGDSMVVTDEATELRLRRGVPCSQASCDACRTGRYNGCPDVVFFSTPPFHGTLSRWHLHPAQWLHRLPENPLAVALAGVERSGLKLGDPTLICEPIVITDLFQSRLDFAKKLVPGVRTVLIKRDSTSKEQAAAITEAAGGLLKVALECTGFEGSVHAAIYSMQFGAKVLIIGVGKNEQAFPFMHLSANEIDVSFLYRYSNQYPKAIRLIAGGLINVKPLVTHRFALEDAISAFHVAADPAQGAIKVQIQD
ncbi:L-arabinitol 4-dehydrogenase [Mycena rebaudengoi]|nr:L-arabinitol 4-dehydrogenase [Mycena rebaudengoi]